MQQYQDYFEANRQLWDNWTKLHEKSEMYDLETFLAGRSSLKSIELEALGDVKGKSLLHLQCHFGQDTLSWARMGAEVMGVDISGEAISLARSLNEKLALDARFIQCNIYDLPNHLEETFDIVFTSYGTIGWLPDLEPWAKMINRFLKPGGTFFIAEFHPFIWMYDGNYSQIEFSYFNQKVITMEQSGSYASDTAEVQGKEHSWNHSLSEVMSVLLQQGLSIEAFQEFDYSPFDCFDNTVEVAPGKYQFKGLEGLLPVVYALQAKKP